MRKSKKRSPLSRGLRKVGKPTKYQAKYVNQLLKYFDVKPYRIETIVRTYKDGSESVMDKKVANDLPLLAGFARKIGISRQTLYNWAIMVDSGGNKIHPEFADAYERTKDCAEDILVTNGLHGLYSTSAYIFTAKNILGWRDNVDVTTGGDKISDVNKYTYVLPGFENQKEEK